MYIFLDASAATTLKPPALRQWIQRGFVPREKHKGGIREGSFTITEIAVLSLTRALSDIGLTVAEAFKLAPQVIEARWINPDPPPLEELRSPRAVMYLWRDADGNINFTFFEDRPIHVASSYSVVDIAAIVTAAIHRANASRLARLDEREAAKIRKINRREPVFISAPLESAKRLSPTADND